MVSQSEWSSFLVKTPNSYITYTYTTLTEGPYLGQPGYDIPVYKYPLLLPPPPKALDIPTGPLIPAYHMSNTKNEPVDVNAVEPELNMDFEENAPQQRGILHEAYRKPREEDMPEAPKLQMQVDSKVIIQRYLPQQADLDKILNIIQKKVLK